jgi:hypothetical protein
MSPALRALLDPEALWSGGERANFAPMKGN